MKKKIRQEKKRKLERKKRKQERKNEKERIERKNMRRKRELLYCCLCNLLSALIEDFRYTYVLSIMYTVSTLRNSRVIRKKKE